MDKHLAITAINLTDRSYFLADVYGAYIFKAGRLYDFWKEHYGNKFLQHMFESQSRIFNDYDLKNVVGLSQIDDTFADDPIKHRAFNFLLAECYPGKGGRGQNVKSVNYRECESLKHYSAFLFFLSVSYKNFDVFAKEINRCNNSAPVELYHYLEDIRVTALMASQRTVDAFCALMKMKQKASRGGKAPKSSESMLHSIVAGIQANPGYSAEELWRHYKRDHPGKADAHDRADDYGVYFEEDLSGLGKHKLVDEEGKCIAFHTFRGSGYFRKAKNLIQHEIC
jgi:hypothetical protein